MGHDSHRQGAAGRLALCAALAALAACPAPPVEETPAEARWVGRAPALRALLDRASGLAATPAGTAADQLGFVLPDCEVVGARAAPDAALLMLETRCIGDDDPLAAALSPGTDLFLDLPAPASRVRAEFRVDDDALRGEIRWPRPVAPGALALLVPGRAPAGPSRLAAAGRLAHAHVRARHGVDFAGWLPAETAAQRLHAWLVGLAARVVLDGTWELAVYAPERPGGLPHLAAALGARAPRLAAAAAARAFDDAARRFGARRRVLHLDAGEGACLTAIPALPELAPCYVADASGLVLGWNRASLVRALAPSDAVTEVAGRIEMDLAGLLGPGPAPPWHRLRVEAGLDDDVLRTRLVLAFAPEPTR